VWRPVHPAHLLIDLEQEVVDVASQPVLACALALAFAAAFAAAFALTAFAAFSCSVVIHLTVDLQNTTREHRGWRAITIQPGGHHAARAGAGLHTVLIHKHCSGSPCAKHHPLSFS